MAWGGEGDSGIGCFCWHARNVFDGSTTTKQKSQTEMEKNCD